MSILLENFDVSNVWIQTRIWNESQRFNNDSYGHHFCFYPFRLSLSYDSSGQIPTCIVTSGVNGGNDFPKFKSLSREGWCNVFSTPTNDYVDLSSVTMIICPTVLHKLKSFLCGGFPNLVSGMKKLDSTKKLVNELLKRERS